MMKKERKNKNKKRQESEKEKGKLTSQERKGATVNKKELRK